ncbi:Transcription repressor OFP8 [Hibiscus syriacus]|uniref:Transcription repressor n=2 Tax=Hibiscus syriacus TaxID=106335 RepID=A0A6A2YG40_HIBSY|nr:Transcription repressor OFP8 [Hibiscus syriacus]
MSSTAVSFSSSSQESANSSNNNNSTYYGGWWIGSEDETETLFSSRTRSSDSSESHRQHANYQKTCKTRRRRAKNRGSETRMKVLPLEETDKVKDNFAIVKSSSDPFNDFRTSMVEMIVERQLFTAKDLEQLLQCFLSLNSHHHHHIIVEVFTDIWETLFA